MRVLHCVFLGLAVAWPAPAQTYTISTYAGGGLPVYLPGALANLENGVGGVAVDGAGNVFLTMPGVVLRLDAITGILTLVAGNGTYGFSGDNGPATSAQLRSPTGVAVDSAGNLYIADGVDNRIRKVSGGVITTMAGNGTRDGFSGDDGPATSAKLLYPEGVAVDSAGNLDIADTYNSRIRKVSGGVITTVAGGGSSFGDNGLATSARLGLPTGIAVDSAGNIYVADANRVLLLQPQPVSSGVINVDGNRSSASDPPR